MLSSHNGRTSQNLGALMDVNRKYEVAMELVSCKLQLEPRFVFRVCLLTFYRTGRKIRRISY